MAANTTPIFALTPKMAVGRITGTTTDRSGTTTTNLITLVSATTDGTKVTQIGYKSTGVSALGNFLIFISDTDGTTLRAFDEILISSITPSTSVLAARQVNFYSDLQLKSGQKILVGVTALTAFMDAFAQIGDF